MNNLNKILVLAACAALFGLTNSAGAQYRAIGEDGIAASPKHREQINERKRVANMPSTTVVSRGYRATAGDRIAASPKLREQLNERKRATSTHAGAVASTGYRATGDDGIAASPKLREQLNERSREFMVAPIK